ncbi:MAG: aspartate--tRNA(Asn) ligase [Nitrososphaeria archaeon]
MGSSPEGSTVEVTGWVEEQRDLGSLIFQVLRDSRGVAQVVYDRSRIGEAIKEVRGTTLQSYVYVRGEVVRGRSRKFPVEIRASEYRLLAPARHPLPLDPSGSVPAGLDVRLDNRPLDLRNPRTAAIFRMRANFLRAAREYLRGAGFLEVNTPKIIGSAAEGGADLFELDYFGRKAYLAQSPQLYKEQLTMSLERVFEIAFYYRAEKFNTQRHLNEFTSVDVEAAMFDKWDAMDLLEGLVVEAGGSAIDESRRELEELGREPPKASRPFPVITYAQALEILRTKGLELPFGEDLRGEAVKLLAEELGGYYFIVDWPLDAKPFYIQPGEGGLSESFDLMFGELELASGGERIHERGLLEERLRAKGLNPEEFRDHLKFYDWGMPPHSGWGFGADRYLMIVAGVNNIRETVLYPRDPTRLTP